MKLSVLTFPSWPYEKKVFVLSASITEAPESVKGKVTILSMDPAALLSHLSSMGYSTVYIDGGKVIQAFLKEDLIDELIISKVPILIGSGIPLSVILVKTLNSNVSGPMYVRMVW